jgi:hypothetical protein
LAGGKQNRRKAEYDQTGGYIENRYSFFHLSIL